MEQSFARRTLRDIAAAGVVAVFMFPLLWWALTSIKPMYAIFNKDRVVVFDFVPTLINYAVVLLGWSRAEFAIMVELHVEPIDTSSPDADIKLL